MVSSVPLACVAPLFVPADRPERFGKAAASGSDAIFIDLEDAVAPAAKVLARDGLKALRPLAVSTFIRVNASTTPWYAQDVEVVSTLPIAGVVLPKSESVEEVLALREKLGPQQAVIALIETAEGLARCRQIACADKAVRLAFGSIDFCADVGCTHTREALLFARSELVLASRLGRILPPLDGVTVDIGNPDLLESDARHAAELGFSGKLCIHPKQIEPAYAGFAPSESELAWACQVLATGDGVVSLNGQMIDEPVRRRAEILMSRARRRKTE
jgi:citrate lyase subunit beta/citryl-CoA lyase